MKNMYVAPSIYVMEVETETIMAASDTANTVEVGMDTENTFGGQFRAKGHTSLWDFDEEED